MPDMLIIQKSFHCVGCVGILIFSNFSSAWNAGLQIVVLAKPLSSTRHTDQFLRPFMFLKVTYFLWRDNQYFWASRKGQVGDYSASLWSIPEQLVLQKHRQKIVSNSDYPRSDQMFLRRQNPVAVVNVSVEVSVPLLETADSGIHPEIPDQILVVAAEILARNHPVNLVRLRWKGLCYP